LALAKRIKKYLAKAHSIIIIAIRPLKGTAIEQTLWIVITYPEVV
jgi:hypothetical protein